MSRIGFVGTGHIAAPMVRHLSAKRHDIVVTERNSGVSAELARDCGVAVAGAQAVLDQSEIVFLCLRPQHAAAALVPLSFAPDHRIMSVVAGVRRDRLAEMCAPAADITQAIPLGLLQSGGCPLAACGKHALLADLFAPENPVVPVADEDALNPHFAICAQMPGLLDLVATGSAWLGQRTQDPEAAEFYTSQLILHQPAHRRVPVCHEPPPSRASGHGTRRACVRWHPEPANGSGSSGQGRPRRAQRHIGQDRPATERQR